MSFEKTTKQSLQNDEEFNWKFHVGDGKTQLNENIDLLQGIHFAFLVKL
jgi:hypothetical protein